VLKRSKLLRGVELRRGLGVVKKQEPSEGGGGVLGGVGGGGGFGGGGCFGGGGGGIGGLGVLKCEWVRRVKVSSAWGGGGYGTLTGEENRRKKSNGQERKCSQ